MKIKDLEVQFRLLKNRKRLEIIRLMSDNKIRYVNEIANCIRLSLKSTSKHLIMLSNNGWFEFKRDKFGVQYKLNQEYDLYLIEICKAIKSSK